MSLLFIIFFYLLSLISFQNQKKKILVTFLENLRSYCVLSESILLSFSESMPTGEYKKFEQVRSADQITKVIKNCIAI